MTDNPFKAPSDADREPISPPLRVTKTRSELAGQTSVYGCFGGALIGTIGFLITIAVIELLLVPPFRSPPNYGQFSIVVIGVGFYASLFGVSLGLVPYISWIGYIPFHLFGLWLIWSMDKQFFTEADWTEAPIAAMLCILMLPTPIAACVGYWARRYPRISNGG